MSGAAVRPIPGDSDGFRQAALANVRLVRFCALFVLGFLALIVPHLAWMVARPAVPSPFARTFLRVLAFAAGLRVERVGRRPERSTLLVANHISWTDILVLGGVISTAFVARADVRGWPVLGILAQLNATIFIDRAARLDVRSQNAALADALRHGRVALFPEGTTGDGRDVLPFRPALLAAATKLPIQPVAIAYAPQNGDLAAFAWDGDKAFLPHLLQVIASGGARCRVAMLPPIPPEYGDRKARAGEARAMIRAALQPAGF